MDTTTIEKPLDARDERLADRIRKSITLQQRVLASLEACNVDTRQAREWTAQNLKTLERQLASVVASR